MSASRLGFKVACIGLGSNLGDSRHFLLAAWQALDAHPQVETVSLSPPFFTAPMEMVSDNRFINAAGVVKTSLPARSLLALLHQIEDRFGRVRPKGTTGYQDRSLDLDLLLYDGLVETSEHLILPHPKMSERCFVLVPLARVAGDQVHPRLGLTVQQMLNALDCSAEEVGLEEADWFDQAAPKGSDPAACD